MATVGFDNLIRVPAIYGADLSSTQILDFSGSPAPAFDAAPQSHLTLTRPAIGYFLSHLAVWRWVIANDF
jgi:glycosyl transferase, family 25